MAGFGGRRGKGRLCNYSVLSKDKNFQMAVNFHIFMGFLSSDFFMLLISNSIPLCFKMTFFVTSEFLHLVFWPKIRLVLEKCSIYAINCACLFG